MAAILSRNMIGWRFEVYRRLGLEELQIQLTRGEIQRNDRAVAVRTPEYRETQNQARNVRRNVQRNQTRQRQPLQYEENPYLRAEGHQ